ncbi:hypothetical protein ACQR35_02340 [Pseudarthrobacter sp. J1738]|uniref:hypothetical protein n=1 Tax=Pseudarthrobacter sp. J1738 TaxID=3420446 RepID=UPI003D27D5B1
MSEKVRRAEAAGAFGARPAVGIAAVVLFGTVVLLLLLGAEETAGAVVLAVEAEAAGELLGLTDPGATAESLEVHDVKMPALARGRAACNNVLRFSFAKAAFTPFVKACVESNDPNP